MKRDVNYTHSKNIGEQIGSFCDVPIVELDTFEMDVDASLETQRAVQSCKAMGCSDTPSTAEVLPGEVICADNIVRRTTTAEYIGYDKYKAERPPFYLIGVDGTMYFPEDSRWGRADGKARQSTPEELCAWLNDMPKRSFKSQVDADGDDKLFITEDEKGQTLCAFRYVGGLPGTYIGGDEVRPFRLPQFKRGEYSPSRVVQYFDNGNAIKVSTEPIKEYADEWACTYIPTSHVERITVGGTALFAPEETA